MWSAALTPRRGPPAGKAVYAETTTAHATLTGLHYYHQDWFHAAAYVTVPPLRLDTNTSAHLLSLLARYPPPGHLGAPRPHPQPLAALLPKHPTLQAPHCMSVPLPKDPAVGAQLPKHPAPWLPSTPLSPIPCLPQCTGVPIDKHPTPSLPHCTGTQFPKHPTPQAPHSMSVPLPKSSIA